MLYTSNFHPQPLSQKSELAVGDGGGGGGVAVAVVRVGAGGTFVEE